MDEIMTKDEAEAIASTAKQLADQVELDSDLVDHKYVAKTLRELSNSLVQLHMSYVNEAYRAEGMKPWMISSRA